MKKPKLETLAILKTDTLSFPTGHFNFSFSLEYSMVSRCSIGINSNSGLVLKFMAYLSKLLYYVSIYKISIRMLIAYI